MKKYLCLISVTVVACIVCLLFVLSGCFSSSQEGFAIYLTKDDISPSRMPALDQVDIADQPLIGMNDIITYNAQTHELKLSAGSYEAISQLKIPVSGKSFVVCVDKKPVYWGAFWTPISSISFDGVTIWKPLSTHEPRVVTLELGYPSPSFYGGEDPRNNPEVIRSLEKAGKLVPSLSITAVNKLPKSMKGYELYSWFADSQWHFTLITGTNRNKTLEEIISGDNFISEVGWVKIQVTGADEIKAVLSKLPQGEYVSWLAGLRADPTPTDSVKLVLPDGATVDSIKEQARVSGLELMVGTP